MYTITIQLFIRLKGKDIENIMGKGEMLVTSMVSWTHNVISSLKVKS